MTTELINQFIGFEIFAEKMEEIVEEVKKYHLKDDDGNTYKFEHFDLRDDVIGSIDSLPTTIKDYAHLWDYVQQRYNEYLYDCENPLMPNEMYFDVYWNNVESNSAFFDDLTLWIYFDYEYGIFYDSDTEIFEKIQKRDEKIENSVVRY